MRHGETIDTVLNVISGHRDVSLTEQGFFQAHNVSKQLSGFGIKSIISSDLTRAKRTAEIIAYELGLLPPKADMRFRERNWGKFEGMPKRCKLSRKDWEKPPEGETSTDFHIRVMTAFNELSDLTMVVTHAGPIRCILNTFSIPENTLAPGEYVCVDF